MTQRCLREEDDARPAGFHGGRMESAATKTKASR